MEIEVLKEKVKTHAKALAAEMVAFMEVYELKELRHHNGNKFEPSSCGLFYTGDGWHRVSTSLNCSLDFIKCYPEFKKDLEQQIKDKEEEMLNALSVH